MAIKQNGVFVFSMLPKIFSSHTDIAERFIEGDAAADVVFRLAMDDGAVFPEHRDRDNRRYMTIISSDPERIWWKS